MRKIALSSAVALAVLAGCGTTSTPDAAPTSTTSTTTTTTATIPAATTSARPQHEDLFIRAMRDKGYIKTSMDETLALAQGDLHCRGLGDGLSRKQLLDSAGLPGSPARQKAEAAFYAAIVSLCPEHAGAAVS